MGKKARSFTEVQLYLRQSPCRKEKKRKSKNMSDHIPKDLRQLRACLSCSLVKSFEQFESDGCDNCDVFLKMKNDRENVYDCTSSNFDGMIATCKPEDSWVCKWQRIGKFKQGVYAVSVSGRLPGAVIRDLQRSGVTYRSRDTSKR